MIWSFRMRTTDASKHDSPLAVESIIGFARHVLGALTVACVGAALLPFALGISQPASAQTMATQMPVNNLYYNQLFAPSQWGVLYPNGVALEWVSDLSDFPPHTPASVPAPTVTSWAKYGSNVYSLNGFFDASQYAADCSGTIYIVNTGSQQTKLCSVVNAPVVDMSFVNQLNAAGLSYTIVYPITDNGNGRAYIVWNSNDSAEARLSANTATWGPNMATTAGYARIEGAGWQNQFAPNTDCTRMGTMPGDCIGQYVTFNYGDQAGDFIASLPSPQQEATLRLEVPMFDATIGTDTNGIAATMLTDSWLLQPPTPPIPLNPLPAPPAPNNAAPINRGNTSTGAGNGTAVGGTGFDPSNGGFDWSDYCHSADQNGRPRSPLWVQNCMRGAGLK
jgi:hypothetical protein